MIKVKMLNLDSESAIESSNIVDNGAIISVCVPFYLTNKRT